MSEISERYHRLADEVAAKVAAVPDDRWESPSPCEVWTARDVVRHVVESQGRFLGLVGRELGGIPSVDDDPPAAWNAARAVVQADLEDPQRATASYEGAFGPSTFENAVDGFGNLDVLVHGWDLARAAGLDERLDPEEVQRQLERTAQMGDALRRPGVCGPEVESPPDADNQTRLLNFLGRRTDA